MAELRTDWLTGRTVILAENRAVRPNEFAAAAESVCCLDPPPDALPVLSRAGIAHAAGRLHEDRRRWPLAGPRRAQ